MRPGGGGAPARGRHGPGGGAADDPDPLTASRRDPRCQDGRRADRTVDRRCSWAARPFDPRARLWGGAGADRPRGAGGAGPPPAARAIHGGHVGHLSLTWCSSRVTGCSSRGHARLGCPRGPAAVRRVTVVVRSSRRATLPEVHPLRPLPEAPSLRSTPPERAGPCAPSAVVAQACVPSGGAAPVASSAAATGCSGEPRIRPRSPPAAPFEQVTGGP